ncbi:MAG: glycosyltransferase [Bacteroidota bacterium]
MIPQYKNPQISAVMSIYNEPEEWLKESIKSILNQTFTDFEFIIINDNPERQLNNTLLHEYQKKDSRIVIIKNETNIGLTKSLNKGLKRAKGKYIARMDGDDISRRNRFLTQFNFMENNPNIVVCGSWVQNIGNTKKKYRKHLKIKHLNIFNYFCIHSPFIHPTMFIRNDILKAHNITYNENFKRAQDYRFALDLIFVGQTANIPKVLLYYRNSPEQVSTFFSQDQVSNSKLIRRQFIQSFFNNVNYNKPVPTDIDINFLIDIKHIKKHLKTQIITNKTTSNDLKTLNSIKYISYLSLNRYSIKTLLHFIFSFDYFFYPYNIKKISTVLYKHIFTSKLKDYI